MTITEQVRPYLHPEFHRQPSAHGVGLVSARRVPAQPLGFGAYPIRQGDQQECCDTRAQPS
jgi:hypothetical protein